MNKSNSGRRDDEAEEPLERGREGALETPEPGPTPSRSRLKLGALGLFAAGLLLAIVNIAHLRSAKIPRAAAGPIASLFRAPASSDDPAVAASRVVRLQHVARRIADGARETLTFDVAGALPSGIDVTHATLTLEASPSSSEGSIVGLYEASATDDIDDAEPSSALSMMGPGSHTFGSTPRLIADIQGWLDRPFSNAGWLVRGAEIAAASKATLTIEYNEPVPQGIADSVLRYLLGMTTDPAGLDVNVDDRVDIADAVLANAQAPNLPPVVASQPIYRAYPGYGIELPIDAMDPEGGPLVFTSADLPEGANLDADTGLVSWTPAADQLGPAYIHFTVADGNIITPSTDGVLIFQIAPLDNCTVAMCDPATGCTLVTKPLSEECCVGEPEIRLAEPEAPCPEGRVLNVGRNERGFGRIQNCDLVYVAAFAQGGANIGLNFETRCVNDSESVSVRVRLETASALFFDQSQRAQMRARPDGFSQALGLTFQVSPIINVFSLPDTEALLTATLTDADGIAVTRQLRVVLTRTQPADLPNPDLIVAPSGEVGCIGCHRPRDPITMVRSGIMDAHPGFALSCTDCHGGDDNVNTYQQAHVFTDEGSEYIRNLAYDKLNEVPLDYVRFINPGDFRVAAQSCGADSPANIGSGCHQPLVDSTPMSVMSTYAGHYKLPRFMAGGQGRDPTVAAVDIVDTDYDPETAPKGTVASLTALRGVTQDDRSSLIAVMDNYLPKSCATCHLSDFGRNDGAGKYRSSGCTACHMVYDDDGLSESEDPAILGYFPPHPIKHELTTAIPTEQCTHCHFQGGRIGLAFRGIREGGFSAGETPPDAVPWGRSIYGHAPNFYFVDEDDTNMIDETPPDLHFDAGMDCMDCHVGSDVHGDGYIYASERDQVGIRCEDCHGTVREAITEDPGDGLFKNAKGYALKRLTRQDDRIKLKLANQDVELIVPQIYELLQLGQNRRMVEAMGVKENGFAHPDKMECYTCHNAWRQTCFGCHVTIDDDRLQYNQTTGSSSFGRVTVTRDTYSTEFFALGMNDRGKMSPLCSSMSLFATYRAGGFARYTDRVRQADDGTKGFGWNPFHHHTVSRTPMNCDSCHPVGSAESPTNQKLLNQAYGFGNGEVLTTDGDGVTHDLTAFLDSQGDLMSSFPHPGTGPVPADVRERALAIPVVPHPR